MNFDEEIREFLVESNENLATLDREIVQLEQDPQDAELISSAFRTIHTIKGTCGFFGFEILGSVTHRAENLLSQVREKQRVLTPDLISLILEAVDAIKSLITNIESTGTEGDDTTQPLQARLEQAHRSCGNPKEPHGYVSAGEDSARCYAGSILPAAASPTGEDVAVLPANFAPIRGTPPIRIPDDKAVQESSSRTGELAYSSARAVPDGVAVHTTLHYTALVGDTGEDEPKSTWDSASDQSNETSREAHLTESTIRVDVALLNRLMNLVGELVLARNQLLQDTSSQNASLQQTSQRLNLITSELQEGVMKTRMQPIGVVWNKLPRVVRDLASKCGKKVQIEMEGAGTELDKTIIEAIKDPLTHIVRNSCDHGIETPDVRIASGKNPQGRLILRAYHEGGVVNIEISDDGAGINPEKVKAKAVENGLLRPEHAAQLSARDAIHLICMPGFSTAAQVTSISGRGVGMDVVKTNIEKIGGSVEVMNRPEGGTTIRIKIPLTLAIIPGLVVTLDSVQDQSPQGAGPKWRREERFIIPQANLLELVRLEGAQDMKRIENVHGTWVFHHRGKLLPLVYLARVLRRAEPTEPAEIINIVVLQAENRQLGLVVDRICDTQEIVVKPLGRQLRGLSCYVGATIMGDGRPALIIDVAGLSRLAGLGLQSRQNTQTSSTDVSASQPQMILLFQAGRYERLAVPLSLVDRLEEIKTADVERAAGRAVLYYRNDILPLVSLNSVLEPQVGDTDLPEESAQIVVFTNGTRRVGLVVDRIVDIVNEVITVRRNNPAPGILGSVVIGGKITDLIDLHSVVQACGENWLDSNHTSGEKRKRIMLMDPSSATRELMNSFLDVSGYDVAQANTSAEAIAKLRQSPMSVVLAAHSSASGKEIESLRQAMHEEDSLASIPLVGLFDRHDQISSVPTQDAIFDSCVVRSERQELLRSLAAIVQQPDYQKEASL